MMKRDVHERYSAPFWHTRVLHQTYDICQGRCRYKALLLFLSASLNQALSGARGHVQPQSSLIPYSI